jgi:hypothetical protein
MTKTNTSRFLKSAAIAATCVAVFLAGGVTFDVARGAIIRSSLHNDMAVSVDPLVGVLTVSQNYRCHFLSALRDRSKLTTKLDSVGVHIHDFDGGSPVCDAVEVIDKRQS